MTYTIDLPVEYDRFNMGGWSYYRHNQIENWIQTHYPNIEWDSLCYRLYTFKDPKVAIHFTLKWKR
jgi:hypothetical protein